MSKRFLTLVLAALAFRLVYVFLLTPLIGEWIPGVYPLFDGDGYQKSAETLHNGDYIFEPSKIRRMPLYPAYIAFFTNWTYGSSLLSENDILDWNQFCANLQTDQRDQDFYLSRWIWKTIPSEARRAIEKAAAGNALDSKEKKALLSSLNEFIQDPAFYQGRLFNEISLSNEAKSILRRDTNELSNQEFQRRNRLLLEAAYPQIAHSGALVPLTLIRLWHVLLDTIVLCCVYIFVRKMFDEPSALIAGSLYSVYPLAIYRLPMVNIEIIQSAALAISIVGVNQFLESPRVRSALFVSLLVAVLLFINPASQFLFAFFVFTLFFLIPRKQILPIATAIVLPALLISLAWGVRNYSLTGNFFLFDTRGGKEMWVGNNQQCQGREEGPDRRWIEELGRIREEVDKQGGTPPGHEPSSLPQRRTADFRQSCGSNASLREKIRPLLVCSRFGTDAGRHLSPPEFILNSRSAGYNSHGRAGTRDLDSADRHCVFLRALHGFLRLHPLLSSHYALGVRVGRCGDLSYLEKWSVGVPARDLN